MARIKKRPPKEESSSDSDSSSGEDLPILKNKAVALVMNKRIMRKRQRCREPEPEPTPPAPPPKPKPKRKPSKPTSRPTPKPKQAPKSRVARQPSASASAPRSPTTSLVQYYNPFRRVTRSQTNKLPVPRNAAAASPSTSASTPPSTPRSSPRFTPRSPSATTPPSSQAGSSRTDSDTASTTSSDYSDPNYQDNKLEEIKRKAYPPTTCRLANGVKIPIRDGSKCTFKNVRRRLTKAQKNQEEELFGPTPEGSRAGSEPEDRPPIKVSIQLRNGRAVGVKPQETLEQILKRKCYGIGDVNGIPGPYWGNPVDLIPYCLTASKPCDNHKNAESQAMKILTPCTWNDIALRRIYKERADYYYERKSEELALQRQNLTLNRNQESAEENAGEASAQENESRESSEAEQDEEDEESREKSASSAGENSGEASGDEDQEGSIEANGQEEGSDKGRVDGGVSADESTASSDPYPFNGDQWRVVTPVPTPPPPKVSSSSSSSDTSSSASNSDSSSEEQEESDKKEDSSAEDNSASGSASAPAATSTKKSKEGRSFLSESSSEEEKEKKKKVPSNKTEKSFLSESSSEEEKEKHEEQKEKEPKKKASSSNKRLKSFLSESSSEEEKEIEPKKKEKKLALFLETRKPLSLSEESSEEEKVERKKEKSQKSPERMRRLSETSSEDGNQEEAKKPLVSSSTEKKQKVSAAPERMRLSETSSEEEKKEDLKAASKTTTSCFKSYSDGEKQEVQASPETTKRLSESSAEEQNNAEMPSSPEFLEEGEIRDEDVETRPCRPTKNEAERKESKPVEEDPANVSLGNNSDMCIDNHPESTQRDAPEVPAGDHPVVITDANFTQSCDAGTPTLTPIKPGNNVYAVEKGTQTAMSKGTFFNLTDASQLDVRDDFNDLQRRRTSCPQDFCRGNVCSCHVEQDFPYVSKFQNWIGGISRVITAKKVGDDGIDGELSSKLEADLERQFEVGKVDKDRDGLFNSVSVALTGSQAVAKLLRIITYLEYEKNKAKYSKLFRNFSDIDNDIDIMQKLKGGYSGKNVVYILSNVIGARINVIESLTSEGVPRCRREYYVPEVFENAGVHSISLYYNSSAETRNDINYSPLLQKEIEVSACQKNPFLDILDRKKFVTPGQIEKVESGKQAGIPEQAAPSQGKNNEEPQAGPSSRLEPAPLVSGIPSGPPVAPAESHNNNESLTGSSSRVEAIQSVSVTLSGPSVVSPVSQNAEETRAGPTTTLETIPNPDQEAPSVSGTPSSPSVAPQANHNNEEPQAGPSTPSQHILSVTKSFFSPVVGHPGSPKKMILLQTIDNNTVKFKPEIKKIQFILPSNVKIIYDPDGSLAMSLRHGNTLSASRAAPGTNRPGESSSVPTNVSNAPPENASRTATESNRAEDAPAVPTTASNTPPENTNVVQPVYVPEPAANATLNNLQSASQGTLGNLTGQVVGASDHTEDVLRQHVVKLSKSERTRRAISSIGVRKARKRKIQPAPPSQPSSAPEPSPAGEASTAPETLPTRESSPGLEIVFEGVNKKKENCVKSKPGSGIIKPGKLKLSQNSDSIASKSSVNDSKAAEKLRKPVKRTGLPTSENLPGTSKRMRLELEEERRNNPAPEEQDTSIIDTPPELKPGCSKNIGSASPDIPSGENQTLSANAENILPIPANPEQYVPNNFAVIADPLPTSEPLSVPEKKPVEPVQTSSESPIPVIDLEDSVAVQPANPSSTSENSPDTESAMHSISSSEIKQRSTSNSCATIEVTTINSEASLEPEVSILPDNSPDVCNPTSNKLCPSKLLTSETSLEQESSNQSLENSEQENSGNAREHLSNNLENQVHLNSSLPNNSHFLEDKPQETSNIPDSPESPDVSEDEAPEENAILRYNNTRGSGSLVGLIEIPVRHITQGLSRELEQCQSMDSSVLNIGSQEIVPIPSPENLSFEQPQEEAQGRSVGASNEANTKGNETSAVNNAVEEAQTFIPEQPNNLETPVQFEDKPAASNIPDSPESPDCSQDGAPEGNTEDLFRELEQYQSIDWTDIGNQEIAPIPTPENLSLEHPEEFQKDQDQNTGPNDEAGANGNETLALNNAIEEAQAPIPEQPSNMETVGNADTFKNAKASDPQPPSPVVPARSGIFGVWTPAKIGEFLNTPLPKKRASPFTEEVADGETSSKRGRLCLNKGVDVLHLPRYKTMIEEWKNLPRGSLK